MNSRAASSTPAGVVTQADSSGTPPPRRVRCDRCGASATVEDGYEKVRRSFRLKTDVQCPLCALRSRQRSENGAWGVLLSSLAVLGLLAWGFDDPWNVLNWIFVILCLAASVPPHELAHALVARALRLHVFRVVIGSGKSVWVGRVLGFRLELRRVPFGGVTILVAREPVWVRSRVFLAVLAGPAANAALALGASVLFARQLDAEHFDAGLAPVTAFVWVNLFSALVSFVPHRVRTLVGSTWSDGGLLVTVPFWNRKRIDDQMGNYFALEGMEHRAAKDHRGAREWFAEGLARHPGNQALQIAMGISLLDLREFEAARDLYRSLLEREGTTPKIRALLLNNLAYADFLCDREELLDEADRCSAEALGAMGWIPAFAGTRGSVLVARGRFDEGVALLQRSLQAEIGDPERALVCCALALASIGGGDATRGRELLETAEQLDPSCVLIERVRRRLPAEPAAERLLPLAAVL